MRDEIRKVAMPADEMVEAGMTPVARAAYRERMRAWRGPSSSVEDDEENES